MTASPDRNDSRMVKLATLWERTSNKGNRYFSGFLGDAQLLMFEPGEVTRPIGEVVQTWKLLVQERDTERRPQTPLLLMPPVGNRRIGRYASAPSNGVPKRAISTCRSLPRGSSLTPRSRSRKGHAAGAERGNHAPDGAEPMTGYPIQPRRAGRQMAKSPTDGARA
jgi:hypothetical protein